MIRNLASWMKFNHAVKAPFEMTVNNWKSKRDGGHCMKAPTDAKFPFLKEFMGLLRCWNWRNPSCRAKASTTAQNNEEVYWRHRYCTLATSDGTSLATQNGLGPCLFLMTENYKKPTSNRQKKTWDNDKIDIRALQNAKLLQKLIIKSP